MPLRSLLALLFCCGAAWWSVASDQSPSDLKIVTRETMSESRGPNAPPFESTYYMKGPRIRTEWRPSSGFSRNPTDPNSPNEYTYGPVIATIQQCDTNIALEINTRDREYEVHPLPHYPTREELKAMAAKQPKAAEPKEKPKPTVTVERHTIDTGERKEFFGYVARHVITTTKNVPHEGSQTLPSETVEDGWFIDLKFKKSCMPDWPEEKSGARLTVLAAGRVDAGPRDVYELKETGPRESGFPVKVVRTYRGTMKMPDGSTNESVHKMETEVVELSTAPLDPALFEEPKGFKKVDHIDRQPPVPTWARVYMWWERVKARLFR